MAESTRVLRKVVDKMVVEVLTTQVSATSSGLHLKDTLLDQCLACDGVNNFLNLSRND